MSSVILTGDTSGTLTVSAPLVAGTNTVTLPASTGTAALTSDVIGVNQTWQDVKASRATGTTYTNSTGKPIMVAISQSSTGQQNVFINGNQVAQLNNSASSSGGYSFIVPNGNTYRIDTNLPTYWYELR